MTDNTTKTTAHTTLPYRLRWSWFPSLLFGDGMLPSVLMLAMIMLRRFGMNNVQTAVLLCLLCLPFILRPLFEKAVAHFVGTTKVWILSAEFIASLSLLAMAFILPTGYWLQGTACFMPFAVVSGIIHNIAMRRFYLEEPSIANTRQRLFAMLFHCVAMLFGIGVMTMFAGNLEVLTRNVRYSWSVVFYIMAGINCLLWLWHSIFLPGGSKPYVAPKDLYGLRKKEYKRVIGRMTHGLGNRMTLLFMLLFILPETFVAIVTPLFFIDAPHNGGLGLSPQEFGLSYGTIGIVALYAGHRMGNNIISHNSGLHRWFLPMSIALAINVFALLYMSNNIAASFATLCLSTFIASMSLGFGFSAYWALTEQFAKKERGMELRRAIAVGILALTMIASGIFSVQIQTDIGYRQFFILAAFMHIMPIVVACAYMLCKRNNKES